ncbi:hypothetical protein LIER_42082 [Lithospermum erythrorhizon]|uniref:BTB domain-containing protein n=1 Tax=Lithospermum erythrorhizon TaxID=34254 RepID=A0AAV3RMS1_LITER
MKEGDRSTSFFHAVIKKKNRKKQIPGILEEGNWITHKKFIAESASNYFMKAFSGDSNDVNVEDLHNFIPHLVTQDHNDLLMAKPSLAVLYFMDGHAMPRSMTSTVISLIPSVMDLVLGNNLGLLVSATF